MVGLDDEIFVIASSGTVIRMAGAGDLLAGSRRHRRAGHEPRRGDETVAAVAPVLGADDDDDA